MPKDQSIQTVLVIGSGPIVIGQAAEFDYAGTQACRVLKREGIKVVLINSNPATIMTDQLNADSIYLEPLTLETVQRVIEKEKPDALLAGLGGQTGLTVAMQLSKSGFLQKTGVRLIGTNAESIDKAEDRQMFKDTMEKIGVPTIPSDTVNTVKDALETAKKIGYPVIIRPAFTLGGTGGGVAYDEKQMASAAKTGLDASPITQILVEKYIAGWKEIEFEVMRDASDHVITVCSMENVDPVGVHTGDSIVVAPALTLSDTDYKILENAAIDIIRELKVAGGCNVQFALHPETSEYAVIEVNPRVSRSSALASKATGYPIAKVTAMIALGYDLDEIKLDKDKKGSARFSPQVDYIVVKFPRWPFDKFTNASRRLGTQMKATGEVMAIAPTFEAGIMKAVRGAEIGMETLNRVSSSGKPLAERLTRVNDLRLFTIFEALKSGMSVADIASVTKITPFFIEKLKNLSDFELSIAGQAISPEQYHQGKVFGYTDHALEVLSGHPLPCHEDANYRLVNTCSGGFGITPYYYSVYEPGCDAREAAAKTAGSVAGFKGRIIVLGAGPIRIGQGIEFDYSSVHCVDILRRLGYEVIIINNNPETVSTDYDTSDRLYFEPLTPEDVMNVVEIEKPLGIVVAFGGQTAIKLAKYLDSHGVKILGTSAEGIDLAEDRERFDQLLESFHIQRPKGCGVNTLPEARIAAKILGYPVLLRPSYVIGGQGMTIARSEADVTKYMEAILSGGIENPVLVDKYMPGTELEVDVISDGETVLIPGIMEHIERAGVHSGDSIAVYPPYNLSEKMRDKVCDCSQKLALALGTKGLVNIQYLIYDNELYVIEVNPRASRTIPYISKVTGVPMVDLASQVMLGAKLKDLGYEGGLWNAPHCFAVKVPVFSFEKLSDADSILGPEMKSTGEVLGVGRTKAEALYKGLLAAGFRIRRDDLPTSAGGDDPSSDDRTGVLLSVEDYDHADIIALAGKFFDLGIKLYATPDTAAAIRSTGLDVETAHNVWENNDIYDLVENEKVSCIVYTGAVIDTSVGDFTLLSRKAQQHRIPCLTSIDTASALADILASRYSEASTKLVDICQLDA
ncbi:MAG: carbamoyl-phosphate synthase large subunit [Firmicutes bacterium]|nr:carbamoyl-phosphate synthase large subunit [Bacillota bacterium]